MQNLTQYQYEVNLVQSWIESPRKFIREALAIDERLEKIGKKVTAQQEEAIEEIRKLVLAKLKQEMGLELTKEDKEYVKKIGISIMSGKGTGKDALTSWMILWFLACFEDAFIPCTANTSKQLRNVLWGEVFKWLKGSRIETWFVWQSEKIFFKPLGGKKWYATALTANVKASEDEQAEMLSGLHENHMMIVVDEASGIPDAIFRPLETTLTWPLNFVMMIFNPTRNTGFAIQSHTKDREDWVCIHWNSEESEIVSRESINRLERKYGRDSNVFRYTVLGLPPKADPDALIPLDWIMDAVNRDVYVDEDDPVIQGIDVGAGGDPSIIASRQGNKVYKFDKHTTNNTMELAGWVIVSMDLEGASAGFIDVIGLGNGTYFRVTEHPDTNIAQHIWPVDVRFRATDFIRYDKLRDELWFNLRQLFEDGIISIPDDDELVGELSILKFHPTSAGKIQVTGKEEFRRVGKSINKADAVMMSFSPGSKVYEKDKTKQKKRSYSGNRYGDSDNLGWLGN
jgi:hypothetical protein